MDYLEEDWYGTFTTEPKVPSFTRPPFSLPESQLSELKVKFEMEIYTPNPFNGTIIMCTNITFVLKTKEREPDF